MGRKVTLNCDLCGREVEAIAAKLYMAPVLPTKTITSFQSNYTHYADACDECVVELTGKMKKRQPRESNGKVTPIRRKVKQRKAS